MKARYLPRRPLISTLGREVELLYRRALGIARCTPLTAPALISLFAAGELAKLGRDRAGKAALCHGADQI